MGHGNIAATGIVLEVLTRDNYIYWSTLVKNYLIGKDLWDDIIVVDPNSDKSDWKSRNVDDPNGDKSNWKSRNGDDPKGEKSNWKSRNGQALHAIQLSCGYQTLGQIRKCETAKDAWNQLKAKFSEDLKADNDIQDEDDLDRFHNAVKKGSWKEAKSMIKNDIDIVSKISNSTGWTSLHVAGDAGQRKIIRKLVNIKPSLLTEKDREGYTALAIVAKSTGDTEMAGLMLELGNDNSLNLEIKAKAGKGDIPILLAASNDHKEMTRFLFSKTSRVVLGMNDYGAKLLSLSIHAEIFDVATALLQHDDTIPLYGSDQFRPPIYELAHIPTAFLSGTRLNVWEWILYKILHVPMYMDLGGGKIILIEEGLHTHALEKNNQTLPTTTKDCEDREKKENNKVNEGQQKTGKKGSNFRVSCGRFQQLFQTYILIKLPCAKKIHETKKNHYLVREILKCVCKRVEKVSSGSELHKWSVHHAMLPAAKYGVTEFLKSMINANPYLARAMDKNKRGILAHAILNHQKDVLIIHELKNKKELLFSKDIFGNNLLHLAAELGPDSYRSCQSNSVLQMQKELQWFKAIEKMVPLKLQDSKNADGMKPSELFTKNHEELVNDGRKWAKETASSFIIVGTLIITIMFAAAFTVPGGSNESNGSPIFLGKRAFSVFILADALSLITSTSSVLTFIGILNSRYAEEDFIRSLPMKFLFGLFTILFSVVFMMWSFCSALALMLKGYRWIVTAGIVFAIIPILVFMFSLLRLLSEVCISIVNPYSFVKFVKRP